MKNDSNPTAFYDNPSAANNYASNAGFRVRLIDDVLVATRVDMPKRRFVLTRDGDQLFWKGETVA